MGFSHKQAALDAIATEIRRAKTMSLSATNKTFVKDHPDWVRDAVKNDFTLLVKQCKEKMETYQKQAIARRLKNHARRKN